ncbi:MAG: phosphoglycerate dehydrogenase [Verrucomicrobiota bacterium JB022]|nr:phosphoglycerate dehydrogenase [Verrucomicrobiota bacterium JB022]
MKVLVADKIATSGVEYLRQLEGFEVIEAYGSTPEKLKELVSDVDAIIVRSASTITADIIAAAPQLKAVGRAGVGVDNIDVVAASDRGITVMNTPGGNTIATAELAFTHLLCSARPIPQANATMKAGKWEKKLYQGTELFQKTLGVLGLGRIGTQVAKRAKAFGMQVVAFDPFLTEARAEELEVEKVELDELYARADFITVHMPKTDSTANMLNADAFAKMKKGVRIVNCARGGLIKEDDLAEALKSGKVAAAGLDVFEEEPLPASSPLREYDNLVMTPHLGASTVEAQENVGQEVAELIGEYLKNGTVQNAVNAPSVDSSTLKLLKPYFPLAYRLGTVIQQLAPKDVKKLVVTYAGKVANLEVKPITRSLQRGFLRKITNDVNDVNAPRVMQRLGIEGDVVKSSAETDYTEMVRIEAHTGKGETYSIEGTLIGKGLQPRIVSLNGREIESSLDEKFLLVLENHDQPGIIGMVGTTLAQHRVNISNMNLGRNRQGSTALAIYCLDSRPPERALDQIREHEAIKGITLVDLEGGL